MKRHLYERNIIEIKSEYTTLLADTIVPSLYEGIKSLYTHSVATEKKIREMVKHNTQNTNLGMVKIFQTYLKNIEKLNALEIERETNRIKNKSKCNDWFDDLLKAVIKSNIVLLTYNVSDKTCKLIDEKYHEKINTQHFIHNCYVESAKILYNNPLLILSCDNDDTNIKNNNACQIKCIGKNISDMNKFNEYKFKNFNNREIGDIFRIAINEAIKKMLPMKLILEEYLANDYINDVSSLPNNDIARDLKHDIEKKDEIKSDKNKQTNKVSLEQGNTLLEQRKNKDGEIVLRQEEENYDVNTASNDELIGNGINNEEHINGVNESINDFKKSFLDKLSTKYTQEIKNATVDSSKQDNEYFFKNVADKNKNKDNVNIDILNDEYENINLSLRKMKHKCISDSD